MSSRRGIKTRIPAARIKRIMRMDEDVGKVSQATPVLIAKALESFLKALVAQGVVVCQLKEGKKLGVGHLKGAIEGEPKFDFLLDIVKDVPVIDVDLGQEKVKRKRRSKKDCLSIDSAGTIAIDSKVEIKEKIEDLVAEVVDGDDKNGHEI